MRRAFGLSGISAASLVQSCRSVTWKGAQKKSSADLSAADIDVDDAVAAMMFDTEKAVATSTDAESAIWQRVASSYQTTGLALGVDTVVRGEIPAERQVADPVPPMDVFNTSDHFRWLEEVTSNSEKLSATGPLKMAYENEGAPGLWKQFKSEPQSSATPPPWFEALCRDLYYRTTSSDAAGESSEGVPQEDADAIESEPVRADDERTANSNGAVDPYLWLPFNLLPVDRYVVGTYSFPKSSTYPPDIRSKLCLGNEHKEYVKFGTAYCFPDRRQLPTSVGTVPASLYVDPNAKKPIVLIQLGDSFPPALWLPVKPSAAAVRRVLAEFAQVAAMHRDAHTDHFDREMEKATKQLKAQQMPVDAGRILRYVGWNARNLKFTEVPANEFPNFQEFFLGEYDDPEKFLTKFDLCPFLFAIPLMRPVVDVNDPELAPRCDGPGVSTSLYRCIFSKALLLVKVHLAAEVKLPPQDPEAFRFLWKESQVAPKSRIPVFVRVSWPDNDRMCGGGASVRQFNKMFGTEFAHDMPIDAIAAIHYSMNWAKELPNLLGIHGMRKRVAELEAMTRRPQQPLLYPGSAEIPNPEYTADERLGMHVQYLGALGDPNVRDVIERLRLSGSAPVRMGCAKAAMEVGDKALYRMIVTTEPAGRNQHYMSKLVRHRKKRDVTDLVPRLLDDQYELAAPLWSTRGVRIDPNTAEGSTDLGRAH